MTVAADNEIRLSYTGSGTTGPFTTPYFLADADIKAIKVLIADGTETELTLTTDYTLTGAGEDAGGSLTLVSALTSSYKLVIINDAVDSQTAEYPRNDAFPSQTHQAVVDRRTMVSQRLSDRLARALRLKDSDVTGIDMELPASTAADRAGTVIGIDGAGTAIRLYDPSSAVTEASNVNVTQSGIGATATDLQSRGRLVVYPQDYMSAAQKADVAAFTGSVDVSDAILAAYTALPSSGGLIKFPPGKYKVDFTGADVVNDPIITVDITKDNVFIEGSGDSTIIDMTGITAAQLNSGSADSAGADAATVFKFNDVDGGGVSNLRFTGTGGGTAITVGKARAKGVGVYNSRRIVVRNVTGANIPGNVVNFRGDSGAEATSTSYCSVEHSTADTCSENGFNFMGGTYRCSLIGCQSHNNQYHGFESGTAGLVCIGNSCKSNAKTGIAVVADGGVIQGNFLETNTTGGISLAAQSSLNSSKYSITGNWIRNTAAASYGIAVTCTDSLAVSNFSITGNYIETAYHGILVNTNSSLAGCSDYAITGNRIKNTGTTNYCLAILAKNEDFVISGNLCEGGNIGARFTPRSRTISTIERASNIVTVVTTAAHSFNVGDRVSISGTSDSAYHGFFDIASTPTSTSFTYAQTGGDDSGDTGGTTNNLELMSFSMIGNRFYEQSADCVYLQGYKIDFKNNTLRPASGATRSGQIVFADKVTFAGNDCQDQTFSISTSIVALSPSFNIFDNTGTGAPLKGSATWDPGSLADGAGETSSAITVTNAQFGDTVSFAAPYDLQGITGNAYVSATNAVKIRLQNETGGSIDLASGTWKVWVTKKQL